MIGTMLWILVVIWLLHLAVPTPFMRRDPSCDTVYYLVWAAVVGIILAIHYVNMAYAGQARLALLADGIALGLFLLGQLGRHAYRIHLRKTTPQPQDTDNTADIS
jgi:hypothetical protein